MTEFTEEDAIGTLMDSAGGLAEDGANGLADLTPGSRTGDGGLCLDRLAVTCVNALFAPRHDNDRSTGHYVLPGWVGQSKPRRSQNSTFHRLPTCN